MIRINSFTYTEHVGRCNDQRSVAKHKKPNDRSDDDHYHREVPHLTREGVDGRAGERHQPVQHELAEHHTDGAHIAGGRAEVDEGCDRLLHIRTACEMRLSMSIVAKIVWSTTLALAQASELD